MYYLDVSFFKRYYLAMIADVIKVNLEALLKERGISLYKLAKDSGIAYENLRKLKNGKATRIYLETIDKICEALDCSPGELLEREPN